MADLSPEGVFGSASPLAKWVDELEAMFPQRTPTPTDDIAKIMYQAGQRSVIEYILAKQKNV